jgi:hypothetical protein
LLQGVSLAIKLGPLGLDLLLELREAGNELLAGLGIGGYELPRGLGDLAALLGQLLTLVGLLGQALLGQVQEPLVRRITTSARQGQDG